MQIQHRNNDRNGAFFIMEDNHQLAEMTYVWNSDHSFIIDHTEVDDKLRGKGAGKQLVMAAVEFARNNNYRIMPLCPFAKAVFQRTPSLNDILF